MLFRKIELSHMKFWKNINFNFVKIYLIPTLWSRLLHELGKILIVNMMYIKSQKYTNMMVGEHGIQTFKVVVIVLLLLLLLFDVFVPTSAHSLLFFDKWFVQIYLNVNY
jgi:hypothetical protein